MESALRSLHEDVQLARIGTDRGIVVNIATLIIPIKYRDITRATDIGLPSPCN